MVDGYIVEREYDGSISIEDMLAKIIERYISKDAENE